MECSCSISAGVDENAEVLSEKWLKARKQHNCQECERQIQLGEQYYREVTKFDGEIDTHKTCADCMSLRRNLCADFYWGQIREMIEDAIEYCDGKIPEKCIAKLTPAARAWVCGVIEKVWEGGDS